MLPAPIPLRCTNTTQALAMLLLFSPSSSVLRQLSSYRESANGFLSRYEPLALVVAPLLALLAAHLLHAFLSQVQERGLLNAIACLLISLGKILPGVSAFIEHEKRKYYRILRRA